MSKLFNHTIPNNVGATTAIPLGPGPVGFSSQPIGLLDFNGDASSPEEVTLSCYAKGVANVAGVPGGPIVGVLSFGSGNGISQRVEFNIPVYLPNQGDKNVWNGEGNGVILAFPMSHCNLGVRHDGNVIPAGLAPLVNTIQGSPGTVQVSCALATGGKNANDHVYRNIYLATALGIGTGVLPGGVVGSARVPSFAFRYRVVRQPTLNTVLNVVPSTNFGTGSLDPYQVPSGILGPWQEIPPGVDTIFVTSDATSTVNIANAVVQFELAI
jgi:hypothetical protein